VGNHFLATATHEASHAATALLLGLEVTEIRADRPDLGIDGWVRFACGDERAILVSLSAGLMDGGGGSTRFTHWPPTEWPILDGEGDQGQLCALTKALEIDQPKFRRLVAVAEVLVATPLFHRLHRAIGAALLRRREEGREAVLNQDEIEAIVAAPLLEKE
jgi:hypothetical protein